MNLEDITSGRGQSQTEKHWTIPLVCYVVEFPTESRVVAAEAGVRGPGVGLLFAGGTETKRPWRWVKQQGGCASHY